MLRILHLRIISNRITQKGIAKMQENEIVSVVKIKIVNYKVSVECAEG